MPVPIVLIEISPDDAPAEHRAALERSCSAAVHVGTCALASDRDPEAVAAIAIVHWHGWDQRTVTIEVGVRRAELSSWSRRSIDFGADDALVERWTAAGLTVASLVGELPELRELRREQERQTTVTPRPTAPPPRRVTRGPTPAASEPSPWWIGIHAGVGTGLSEGTPRLSGAVRGAYRFRVLPLTVHVEGGFGVSGAAGGTVTAREWTGLAGFGLASDLPALDLGAGVRVLGGVRLLNVSALDPPTGAEATGERLAPMLMEAAEVWWPARGWIAVCAGVDAWQLPHPSRVFVRGEAISDVPTLGVGGQVGARVFLP